MKKAWSISTTVRNPERLRNFLVVLKELEGKKFDEENQKNFQILLIQKGFYVPINLPGNLKERLNNGSVSFKTAKEVFDYKDYVDSAIRGRQSINPLRKLGFCVLEGEEKIIRITKLGELLLDQENDIGDIFFKCLLKLQFPNLISSDFSTAEGFNISPFIATLHLFKYLNTNADRKGMSKNEFYYFVPTLINYSDIENQKNRIIAYRESENKENFIKDYLKGFYGEEVNSNTKLNDLKDYGDNILRFFRLTRLFKIKVNESSQITHIDLENSRGEEINQLISLFDGSAKTFVDKDAYISYIADINQPKLPWEELEKVTSVAKSLVEYINIQVVNNHINLSNEEQNLIAKDFEEMPKSEMVNHISKLREINKQIRIDINRHELTNNIESLQAIIEIFRNRRELRKLAPEQFEKLIYQALVIINDQIQIKANYPTDDDGEPINHAVGNKPDIEVSYHSYEGICEVTLNTSNKQWMLEGQPVMRHLRDFEQKATKDVICLFVSPEVHRDTINTFWNSIKHGFEGIRQNIIPLSIEQFIVLLETFIECFRLERNLSNKDFFQLFNQIFEFSNRTNNSIEWANKIQDNIINWKSTVLSNEA